LRHAPPGFQALRPPATFAAPYTGRVTLAAVQKRVVRVGRVTKNCGSPGLGSPDAVTLFHLGSPAPLLVFLCCCLNCSYLLGVLFVSFSVVPPHWCLMSFLWNISPRLSRTALCFYEQNTRTWRNSRVTAMPSPLEWWTLFPTISERKQNLQTATTPWCSPLSPSPSARLHQRCGEKDTSISG